jgi:hypothetical protein
MFVEGEVRREGPVLFVGPDGPMVPLSSRRRRDRISCGSKDEVVKEAHAAML